MAKGTCTAPGCTKIAQRREWCTAHYKRWKRHGDPTAGRTPIQQGTPIERFWAKVNKDGPLSDVPGLGKCWIWTGFRSERGYGKYTLGDVWVSTHRAAYQDMIGPIPEGLELDHLCRNPPCCNPYHLEPVTGAENMRRCRIKVCIHGHDFEANIYVSPKGVRQCGACMKVREESRPPRYGPHQRKR